MQDDSHYGALTFTIQDARALAARITDVVTERDQLLEEVSYWREVMAELEGLRQLLDHDTTGAMVATAASNGHLSTAHVQAQGDYTGEPPNANITSDIPPSQADHHHQADDTIIPDAEMPAVVIETEAQLYTGETDANCHLEQASGESPTGETTPGHSREQASGESPTGETTPGYSREQASGESPTGETTPGYSREQDSVESRAGETRPPEGSLMARILQFIEASDRPKRPWQIQKELVLPRTPTPELSRLVTMGHLTRPKEGIYGVPGRNYSASVLSEGNNS
jgi:hypothetical protein